MDKLFEALLEKEYTIASCESLTAGLFTARLAEVPHVSQVLKGGICTYWTEIKNLVVGVSEQTTSQYGVVSEQTAREMAYGVQKLFDVNVAVSFTGNAGPDALEGKPVGMVFTGILINDEYHGFQDLIELPRNELRSRIIDLTAERIVTLLGESRRN